jgi:hypothetical protein
LWTPRVYCIIIQEETTQQWKGTNYSYLHTTDYVWVSK